MPPTLGTGSDPAEGRGAPSRPGRRSARATPGSRPIASWRTLRRLGYRARLEAEAFRSLGRRDLGPAREAFRALSAGLCRDLDPAETRLAAQLLLDVLQRVNDAIRLYRPDPTRYHAARIWLIAFS